MTRLWHGPRFVSAESNLLSLAQSASIRPECRAQSASFRVPLSSPLAPAGPTFEAGQRVTTRRRDDGFTTNEKLNMRRSVSTFRGARWEPMTTQQRPTAMRVSGTARRCLNAPRRDPQQMVDMWDNSASESPLVCGACTLTCKCFL